MRSRKLLAAGSPRIDRKHTLIYILLPGTSDENFKSVKENQIDCFENSHIRIFGPLGLEHAPGIKYPENNCIVTYPFLKNHTYGKYSNEVLCFVTRKTLFWFKS